MLFFNNMGRNISFGGGGGRNNFKCNFGTKIVQFCFGIYAIFISICVSAQGHNQGIEFEPDFLSTLDNLTVTQGRDISFTCVVNNLGQYRVAWIKSDSKAILGIHTHMVSLNPRLSVTHNGHNTWKLHISHVQLNDSGSYMCQVNTDPMKSQSGYLNVVVPPDILSSPDSNGAGAGAHEEGITNEGGIILLICSATGVPEPTVMWRREGGKDIVLRHETREKQAVKTVEGERLYLTNVQRTDMGGYLCIASNGVPPSVSKRFDVHINFPPSVKAINELLAAPVERSVTLECIVEVYPKPLNGWYKNEGNIKLHDGPKYNISEAMLNMYTWQLNLTIRNLQKNDFGAYSCSSVNALGKSEALIRLQELRLPPKPTTTPTPYITTQKPRRKTVTNHNKNINEVVRVKETAITNHILENDVLNSYPEVHTPLTPSRNGYEKARNSQQPPAVVPSPLSPWVIMNGTQMQSCDNFTTITTFLFLLLYCYKYILNEMVLT
ncbi:lachesin [Condylostylus longicornis]|uniref:lachesin n=1 Tax=Condylostylus longicornis TaxID=2530218 RepID=UPI00244E4ED6|nr:lachesin [Condylostylus longicornis]